MRNATKREDCGRRSEKPRNAKPGAPRAIRLRSVLGMALERYRLERGLGLNELARRAGIQAAQLSRLEGGHQVTAHASTLRKLADALDVDVQHLMRLRQVSQEHPCTTADIAETLEKARMPLAEKDEVKGAIERDDSFSKPAKEFLLGCVAFARLLDAHNGKPLLGV